MHKKVGIMQPYFFPYIGYWQLLNAVDEYVVYDDVNFIKQGWINRNNILVNNQSFLITFPLNSASSFRLIKETYPSQDLKQKMKLLKTIDTAYNKAPYYKDVIGIISNAFFSETNIAETLFNSILEIAEYLGIKTKILLSSKIQKNIDLKSDDKIIDIVKRLNGNIYINAIGGKDLYDKEKFKINNLELFFLKTNSIQYKQFNNEFIPNLSIIDVLMFNNPEKIKEMLVNYELH